MKKFMCVTCVVFGLGASAFAQTTNSNYTATIFGAPHVNTAGGERSDTRSIAADGKGSILVLRRSDPQVLIFNRAGELQDSWGEGLFLDSHNIDVDHEGFVWIGDRSGQMIYKFTMDGQQVMALGTKGVAGNNSSPDAFNRASDVAVAPNGDIFVADGYRNNRIVHFSSEGAFIKVIGGVAGKEPGEFEEIHGVQIDSRGRLIVLDGHSNEPRIQVWDQNGTFIEEWPDLNLIMGSGFTMDADDTVYVGDTDGERIKVVKDGRTIEVIGGLEARPHNITLDPETGALYLADTGTLGGKIKKIIRK